MKLKLSLCLVSAAMLMISCSRPGIVANSTVTIQSPLKSVSIASYSDTYSFSTVSDPRFLQICFDTVLVVQQTVHTEGDWHFKAFSTVTSDSLGSFFHNGRGPGEMYSPHMEKTHSGDNCLGIVENGTGTLSVVDIKASLQSDFNPVHRETGTLPSGVISSASLGDSSDFLVRLEGETLHYDAVSKDGRTTMTFNPFRKVNAQKSITQLSSILMSNEKCAIVAEVMLFLPQINFYDVASGKIKTTAVDKAAFDWRPVMENMIGPETVQYYQYAAYSPDYIFAVYCKATLAGRMSGNAHTAIHVFNWEGDFLYDFKVNESLSDITYDAQSKILYAINRADSRIIRYELSEYL